MYCARALFNFAIITLTILVTVGTEYVDPFDMFNYNRNNVPIERKENDGNNLKTTKEAIDPFDMFNYNRNNIPLEQNEGCELKSLVVPPKVENEAITCNCNCENPDNENNYFSEELSPSNEHSKERVFLIRFIEIIYTTLMLKERELSENDIVHIPLSARVTKRVETTLRGFLNKEDGLYAPTLADLDEVISELISLNNHCSPAHSSTSFWEIIRFNGYPKDWLLFSLVTSFCTICIMAYRQYSNRSILATIFIFFLGISWYWEWCNLYQLSLARQQSDLTKYSEMPASCKPASLNQLETVMLWIRVNVFKGPDPCEKYYEVILTDPIYENTPLKALSNTVATVIFHPLGYAGESVGSFFEGLLGAVSWYYKIPVLVVVVMLIMYLLLLFFNYHIDIPFLFASIRPNNLTHVTSMRHAVNSTEEISRPESSPPTLIQSSSEQRLVVVLKVVTEPNKALESSERNEDTGLILGDSVSAATFSISSEESIVETITSESGIELTDNLPYVPRSKNDNNGQITARNVEE